MSFGVHPFTKATTDLLQSGCWYIAEVENLWRSTSSSGIITGKTLMTRQGAFAAFFVQGEGWDHCVSNIGTGKILFYFRSEQVRDNFLHAMVEAGSVTDKLIPDWSDRIRRQPEGTMVEATFYYAGLDYIKNLKADAFGTDARALFVWAMENCTGRVWQNEQCLVFEHASDAALYKLKFYGDKPPAERTVTDDPLDFAF